MSFIETVELAQNLQYQLSLNTHLANIKINKKKQQQIKHRRNNTQISNQSTSREKLKKKSKENPINFKPKATDKKTNLKYLNSQH